MYNQNLQMILMNLLNIASFMYLGSRGSPFSKPETKMLIFNEFVFHIISFHMHLFAGLAPEAKSQEIIGYSMIAFIILVFFVNFKGIFVAAFNVIRLTSIKYYKRFKFRNRKG